MAGHLERDLAETWLSLLDRRDRATVVHLLHCPRCRQTLLGVLTDEILMKGAGPSSGGAELAGLSGLVDLDLNLIISRIEAKNPAGAALLAEGARARAEIAELLEAEPKTWLGTLQARRESNRSAAFTLALVELAQRTWRHDSAAAGAIAELAIAEDEPHGAVASSGVPPSILLGALSVAWAIRGYASSRARAKERAEEAFGRANQTLREGAQLWSGAEARVLQLLSRSFAGQGRLSEALATSQRAVSLFAAEGELEEQCSELLSYASLLSRADALEEAMLALEDVLFLTTPEDERLAVFAEIARRRLSWLRLFLSRRADLSLLLQLRDTPRSPSAAERRELDVIAMVSAFMDAESLEQALWSFLESVKRRRDSDAAAVVCLHIGLLLLDESREVPPEDEQIMRLVRELAVCIREWGDDQKHRKAAEALSRLRKKLLSHSASPGDVLDAAAALTGGDVGPDGIVR